MRRGHPYAKPVSPLRTLISAVHPHPSVKINHGATFMVTDLHGAIRAEPDGDFGLYSSDTRFLSRHEVRVNGKHPDAVASVRLSFRQARWHMVADNIADPSGDTREARVAITLDRLISLRQMHEELTLHTYAPAPVTVLLEIALESDFADLFEVRFRSWQRRTDLNTHWVGPNALEARYQNKDFVRRCLVRALPGDVEISYANGSLRFPVDLTPGKGWKVGLQYDLLTDARALPALATGSVFAAGEADPMAPAQAWQTAVSQIEPGDSRLRFAYERAIEDFAALRLHEQDSSSDHWMPAAAPPWFLAR